MDFIAQVYRGNIKWYHYLAGVILTFVAIQLGSMPLLMVALSKLGSSFELQEAAATNFMHIGINTNLYFMLMIIPFAFGLAGLLACVKYINKIPVRYVLTSRKTVDWQRVAYAFALWFFISLGLLVLDYALNPLHFELNFKPIPFLILVLVSFLFLPFQTSFEELIFRGYLMQAFGVLTCYRLAALILTSTIFGLLHGANPEVAKLGSIILVYYIGTGFLFGIIALMDEGIELTLGLHAANNIVAALFVTTNWTVFQTDALFIDNSEPHLSWLMFLPVFVVYPLLLWGFSKKYRWKDWQKKLTGKVERPIEITKD